MSLITNVSYGVCFFTLGYFLFSSRLPDNKYGCHNFECTLNSYGVCRTGWVTDLFFVCYPSSCGLHGIDGDSLTCQLSQSSVYPCVKGYCATNYYSPLGSGNILWLVGFLHIAITYLHVSLFYTLYILFCIGRKFSFLSNFSAWFYALLFLFGYYVSFAR